MSIDELIREAWERARFEELKGGGFDFILDEMARLTAENARLRDLLGGDVVGDLG